MFYTVKRTETLIVPPQDINTNISANITQQLRAKVEGQITQNHGLTIAITKIEDVRSNGIIDVNDGSVHFKIEFECFVLAPRLKDVFPGFVAGMTDRNLLIISCGPLQCLVHPDQILKGTYTFEPQANEFIHNHGTSPPITVGTTVWVQVLNETFSANNAVVGSIIKVCDAPLQNTMGE